MTPLVLLFFRFSLSPTAASEIEVRNFFARRARPIVYSVTPESDRQERLLAISTGEFPQWFNLRLCPVKTEPISRLNH